jgi:methionyl-tRNA formyltransferase
LRDGLSDPQPQQGEPTYAAKLDPAELELLWEQPATILDRLVRVGGAWSAFRGRRLKVVAAEPVGRDAAVRASAPGVFDGVEVATGDGALRLVTVQPEGKAPMPADAWLNGLHQQGGEQLGS